MGIRVHPLHDGENLPLPDESFDLVINRHESFDPFEVYRILKPGGLFITQQVGGRDNIALNHFLAPGVNLEYADWDLERALVGFNQSSPAYPTTAGSLPRKSLFGCWRGGVLPKSDEWQIPGFDVPAVTG